VKKPHKNTTKKVALDMKCENLENVGGEGRHQEKVINDVQRTGWGKAGPRLKNKRFSTERAEREKKGDLPARWKLGSFLGGGLFCIAPQTNLKRNEVDRVSVRG